jgi:glycosyltransferase involved in cell wall biosynthesis
VTLLVEGLSAFPLAEPLKKYSRVLDMDEQAQLEPIDLIVLDEPTDTLVASLPAGSPIICVIHRKTSAYSQEIQDRCDQFLCFTEAALEYRSTKVPPSKLRMVHHGVDLQRFRPSNEIPVQRKTRPNLLFYTRLDGEEVTMWRVLEQLLRCDVRLTMLGDGDAFWKISDQYGGDLTLIRFTRVISRGRRTKLIRPLWGPKREFGSRKDRIKQRPLCQRQRPIDPGPQ